MNDQITKRVLQSMTVLILAVFALGVVFANVPVSRSIFARSNVASSSAGSSYLYRFDPNSQTWFTYTLPIGALPQSVATTGTNPVHVWVAEYGLNKIGHLIYTDTSHTSFVEYPVTSTANSQPFRVTLNGNYVWFTERGANRVGRLDATTGQIDEFYGNGLSSNAGLADIKVAPNGWVWLAGQWSNQIIRLVLTPTVGYAFTGYSDTFCRGPFGLAIESDNSIWLTAPTSHRIGQFTPSDGSFVCPSWLPGDSSPLEIVFADYAWFSDWQGNRIGQMQIGTMPIPTLYGPIPHPAGLASESANRFWVTQQGTPGAIARFIYTSTVSTQFDTYPLPIVSLSPMGIAVAADKGVWLTAYSPWRIYLPLIYRS